MWQEFRDLRPAPAVAREFELGPQQFGTRVYECCAIAAKQIGRRQRAIEAGKLRFVVEHLQMARRSRHKEKDDVLHLALKVRLFGCERVFRFTGIKGFRQKAVQRKRPHADTALLDEPAPRDSLCLFSVHSFIPSLSSHPDSTGLERAPSTPRGLPSLRLRVSEKVCPDHWRQGSTDSTLLSG